MNFFLQKNAFFRVPPMGVPTGLTSVFRGFQPKPNINSKKRPNFRFLAQPEICSRCKFWTWPKFAPANSEVIQDLRMSQEIT